MASCFACLLAAVCLCLAAEAQTADPATPSAVPPAGIWGLEFSPDGKWLAAGTNARGHGGPIVIWRVQDWTPHVVHMEPTGGLHVAFSPDGKLLAYSTRGPQVGLIDVSSGKLARSIKALDTEQGIVYSVAFSPDGKSLLTSGTDRRIKEWSLADGSLKRTFEGHSDTVNGIALSPDGSLLLSGGREDESRLWDMSTGAVIQVFKPGDGIVRRVRFSPDGRFFLTSKWDGKTRIRDTTTRQLRAVLTGSNSAALRRDNRLAATASRSTVSVYRLQLDPPSQEQRQRIRRLIRQLDDDDYSVREAASEEVAEIGLVAEPFLKESLDAASAEVRVRARRLRKRVMSPQPIAELSGHRGDLEVVCLSPDDKLLATGCRGGDLRIWSVPEFEELVTLTAPPAE
jgi:WD40 repeat protein